MKTYKIKKAYIVSNSIMLIFPVVLTAITFSEGAATNNEVVGLGMFWLLCLLITLVPILFRVEVGSGEVKTYFAGFLTSHIRAQDVEVVEYGNLLRGGLGVGNGLKIWSKKQNGSKVYRSIGERAYGKKAIEEIRSALSK